jgi:CDP-glucose 4,6-dehydratase
MFGGAYAGRRVFVTGHTGFKGAWLTLWLLELGADVTGYALDPPTDPSLFVALGLDAGERSGGDHGGKLADLRGDVRDLSALGDALRQADPEIVFHLAAQPLVRRSYAEPHLTYETNVMGTVAVLEGVRALAAEGRGPRSVIVVTSDKCYENRESTHAYAEEDPLGGWDPYSSSKACAELVCSAYRRSFFASAGAPALATARAGNVIGGGDWGEDRILPDCARAISRGEPLEVRSPQAVRPWQHVLESLSGYLWLAARIGGLAGGDDAGGDHSGLDDRGRVSAAAAAADGAWNFGPGGDAQVTVREVVEQFIEDWGEGVWRPAPDSRQQPHEAGLLALDAGKADRELGWRPAWGAREAVARAAGWYGDFHAAAGRDALLARCRGDIASYTATACAKGIAWAAGELA